MTEIDKYLICQEGNSNKFWHTETIGAKQIIKWGAIGSIGRVSQKEFESAEACQKETQKLIAQKLKSGYKEVENGDRIPQKAKMSEEEEEELIFWTTIDKANKWKKARWREYNIEEHIENIVEILSKKSKKALIAFERRLRINLHKLYTAQIAELNMILECGFKKEGERIIFDSRLSDDGFIYFRCWLLLKGKEFFDEISKNINAFLSEKYNFFIDDVWAESLLYASDEAYSQNNENPDQSVIKDVVFDMPDVTHYDSSEKRFDREPLSGDKLQSAYSDVVAHIISVRELNLAHIKKP
ncbi:MAG: DUF4240 domain-containing protein [Helicobacteraceae bacterium]|jgi:predicted DNA-binding WGR domain protein|nr:DUF4240 domain-containing protein [Helicobacteraceae bacterium]